MRTKHREHTKGVAVAANREREVELVYLLFCDCGKGCFRVVSGPGGLVDFLG
jgi:hypothetical protein